MTSTPQVQTVRGPVAARDLGTVLMHEHAFVLNEELRQSLPETWDEQERISDAVTRLKALAATGVTTIVAPTVIGLGRNVARVAQVNEQVDLHIVAATGLYTLADIPDFFRLHGPGTMLGGPEAMTELFVRELTEGIADTGVRAAFLKCAVEDELTPGVERVMRAVAQAHLRTGAPITVHTNANARTGLAAQDVLRGEGVDLGAVVIGHSGDTTDLDYLHRLIDSGSYVGMDRFGLDILLPGDQRVATVAALAREGFAERMVLSHDASCHIDWFPPGVRERIAPNWHYTHLHDEVLPALRRDGVPEAQLTTMLVDNPRRYFSPANG
ncbi:parathion hydrolase [Streptomyces sp. L-9-10]|uniref:phosphotriesterase family protein n=1 Tax=Streptomyces sp. L-9-10 TaxID=1478131 RepID=UPI00101C1C61|nr:phosphotriesterase [Streptomyces sp. L-9-10]RYJ32016.1 parathion hydrolase [Streptomyces sp. L-9-10]